MWERFCGLYQWEPRFNERVEHIFRNRLKSILSNVLSTARTYAISDASAAGTPVTDGNFDVLKPYNTSWIDPSDWARMIDLEWNTTKWQEKSKTNKKNKATLIDGEVAKHTSGSVSFELTKHRMGGGNGQNVNSLDWYKKCHLKRVRSSSSIEESGNTSPKYVTQKAKKVAECYEELLEENFGPDPKDHPHIGDFELWLKACGGMKKGRLFGYGTPEDPCFAVSGTTANPSTATSNN